MIKYLNNEICIEVHSLERYNIFSKEGFNILKKIDAKRQVSLLPEFYLEQRVSRFYPARMRKKVYTQCTAAVLRAKDCVMKTVTNIQENAEDIYSEAMQINAERTSEDSEFENESETKVDNDAMKTEE